MKRGEDRSVAQRLRMNAAMREVLVDTVRCAIRDAVDLERVDDFERRLGEVVLQSAWPEDGVMPDPGMRRDAQAIAASIVDEAWHSLDHDRKALREVNDCDICEARLALERGGHP